MILSVATAARAPRVNGGIPTPWRAAMAFALRPRLAVSRSSAMIACIAARRQQAGDAN